MRSAIVRWKDIADSIIPREELEARDRQIADFISSKVRPLCFRMGGLDYFFNKAYAARAVR